MRQTRAYTRLQRWSALIAGLFGIATIIAGGRVLLGGDAGYEVVRPVLLFNTAMGVVYLATAMLILRDPARGRLAAIAIASVNLLVLLAVIARRAGGGIVATETLVAMTLRTVVWIGIAAALGRERAGRHTAERPGRR